MIPNSNGWIRINVEYSVKVKAILPCVIRQGFWHRLPNWHYLGTVASESIDPIDASSIT